MLPASMTYRPMAAVKVQSVFFAALTVDSMCGILLAVGITSDSLVMVAMVTIAVILYVPALSGSGGMLYRFGKRVLGARPPRYSPESEYELRALATI